MSETKTFSYLPGTFGDKRAATRAIQSDPSLAGESADAAWILGTEAMFKHSGESKRRRALLAARLEGYRERAVTTIAVEPAIDAWRPSDPALLTGMDLGEFQYTAWPGQLILPEVMVQPTQGTNGTLSIEIPQWGNEHFALFDTSRGIDAGYNTTTTDPNTITRKLDLYGFATKKDIRVVAKADSFLNISARHASLALRSLMLDRERRVRNVILDTTPYTAGHAVTLTTEWDDASGDSKADWDSLLSTMTASSGIPRELFTITLASFDSLDAAYNDPTFLAQRTSTLGTSPSTATLSELARYWRVLRVNVADVRVDIAGVVSSLWGDVATATWQGQTAVGADISNLTLEDFMGTPFLGATFVGNPGLAMVPFESRDGLRTQMVWPVDAADLPTITTFNVLGLLQNVKA